MWICRSKTTYFCILARRYRLELVPAKTTKGTLWYTLNSMCCQTCFSCLCINDLLFVYLFIYLFIYLCIYVSIFTWSVNNFLSHRGKLLFTMVEMDFYLFLFLQFGHPVAFNWICWLYFDVIFEGLIDQQSVTEDSTGLSFFEHAS